MELSVWLRKRTIWHEPERGWFSLPPGVSGNRVWLDELQYVDRKLFGNILKRFPDCVLVFLAGRIRAINKTIILEAKSVIDATDLEKAAISAALVPLGDYVAGIGMHRPLADYSKQEVITLIDVVVSAYQNHIASANPNDIPF